MLQEMTADRMSRSPARVSGPSLSFPSLARCSFAHEYLYTSVNAVVHKALWGRDGVTYSIEHSAMRVPGICVRLVVSQVGCQTTIFSSKLEVHFSFRS